MRRSALVICSTLLISGCAAPESANLVPLEVDFSWQGTSPCTTTPPAFEIRGIPAETRNLSISLVDLNVPSFNHGGGRVSYSGGSSVPAGAFTYRGPCPPMGSTHRYEFTVSALDGNGRVIGRGRAVRPFPP
ncbi:MAG: phospholipid-binding protein [Roseomonas sp.]|nr:phospholipid-binding protein [Roseomonas sp.]MCA3428652.1 phospholipid-binding protein [Roseomonas sp.]MCA3434869.1 phospholipid-binding protein [Roseomonas sp.]